jgi:basic membrane protein A and related proteins
MSLKLTFALFTPYRCLILAGLILVFGSCRTSEVSENGTGAVPFRVALLTPGPVSDAGWNASAFDGTQLIKSKMGAEVAMVQTDSPADFEDAMRDFAARGYSVIFAHGFEYTDAALNVGREFPHTWFIVTSGSTSSANVASLNFKTEQATYVEGVLAGGMSKSGIAGAVGGIEIPALKVAFEGFRRGFVSMNPHGRLLISFIGSFNDVGAAKEAALAQIGQGADFLIHDADAAGLGVFDAASESHIYAFGYSRDQNSVAPQTILASAVSSVPDAFLHIAMQVKQGSFRAGMIQYGMADGMVRMVVNPQLAGRIPSAVMARAKQAEQQIIAGTLIVPGLPPGS